MKASDQGRYTLALLARSDLCYHSSSRLLSVHPLDGLRLYLIVRPWA